MAKTYRMAEDAMDHQRLVLGLDGKLHRRDLNKRPRHPQYFTPLRNLKAGEDVEVGRDIIEGL